MKMKLIGAIAGLTLSAFAYAETSPTAQGKTTLRLNGGVAPTTIKADGLGKTTKNSKFAELQVGHFFQDNLEFFGEISRFVAKGKSKTVHFDAFENGSFSFPSSDLSIRFKDAKSTGFYLGSRYHFPTETRFTPYIGAKAGFIHHEAQRAAFALDSSTGPLLRANGNAFKAENKLSAGVLAGVDFNVTENTSIGVGIEHIVSGKRKDVDGVNSTGLVRYTPIFASVKYSFDM